MSAFISVFLCVFFQNHNATYAPEHTCTARSQLKTQNSRERQEGGKEGGNAQRTIFRAKITFNSSPLAKPLPLPPRSRLFKKKKKKKKIQGEPQFQFLILMTVREVSEREDVTGLTEGFSFFFVSQGS